MLLCCIATQQVASPKCSQLRYISSTRVRWYYRIISATINSCRFRSVSPMSFMPPMNRAFISNKYSCRWSIYWISISYVNRIRINPWWLHINSFIFGSIHILHLPKVLYLHTLFLSLYFANGYCPPCSLWFEVTTSGFSKDRNLQIRICNYFPFYIRRTALILQ